MTEFAKKVLEGVVRYRPKPPGVMVPDQTGVWVDHRHVMDVIARMGAGDDLVGRLLTRAVSARQEKTATALGDALHFEEAAACIAALKAQIDLHKDRADINLTSVIVYRERAEAAEAEVAALRLKLQAMHRRAQKAEGLSHRSANLLETIMGSVKEAMKPDAKLSLHSLFHRVRAARDHARSSSGRAFIEGFHYLWPQLKEAEAERDALRAVLAEARVYVQNAADGDHTHPQSASGVLLQIDGLIHGK